MKCPKCGAVIPDGSRFCNICGEKVNIPRQERRVRAEAVRPRDEDFDIAPTVRKKPERSEPEDHDQKDWVKILILFIGITLAFIGVWIFNSVKKNRSTTVNVATTASETAATAETTTTLAPSERETETVSSVEETVEESEASEEETSETVSEETSAEETESAAETVSQAPAEELEYGGVIYRIENGQATLLRCYSADAVMEMPAEVYGVPCTAIAAEAFKGCTHLTHIDLPEGYRTIGAHAFDHCTNLKEIVLPDSISTVEDGAFDYCVGFTIISHIDTFAYALATNNRIPWVEGTVLTIYSE